MSFLEQVTGLEPVISAWKANVFPLHYTCMRLCEVVGGCNKTKSPFINGQMRCPLMNGAGNGARTRHLSLGKAALYQMSYSRKKSGASEWT